MTKTVLITGANGFLGRNVVEAFKGKDVYTLTPNSRELDLTKEDCTLDYFQRNRPELVLHMAAVCGGIKFNSKSPAILAHENVKMATNIFEAVRKYGDDISGVYNLGTVCSYPVNCPIPFKEENILNGAPESTNSPYGQAKRMLSCLHQSYMKQYNMKGAFFLPANMFGYHDAFDLENSHVIPALINKFCNAVDNNLPVVECWGSGKATRAFLFAEDCANILVKAVIEEFSHNEPINIGPEDCISIRDLAYLIGKLTGFQGSIVFENNGMDGQPMRQLDVSRAKGFGFKAKTNFEDGLNKTIQWYRKNR